jgi:integrase
MSDEIKVHVINYGTDRNLMLRYRDPVTGKHIAKSSGTRSKREAERAAGKWQAELCEGRYQKPSRITWEAFRERYVESVLPGLSGGTATTYEATLNVFEEICNPDRLAKVTTATITDFVAKLRAKELSEATIARHLRALRAVTRWAKREGLLSTVPTFAMPPRVKGSRRAKGRAPTTEEFERMLKHVPKVVENVAAESWKFYLRGLWLSSLRLTESLTLRWDYAPNAIVVDMGGRRPMFLIPADVEKGNEDRLLPMTPDFAEFLKSVPESQRQGRVFKLMDIDGKPLKPSRHVVGPIVSAIGKSAGVVVDARPKNGKPRKFASAHDLRRAFGFRWAMRVMPAILQQLMRHADIQTTMDYYVVQDAEAVPDAVWAAVGNTVGNSPAPSERQNAENPLKASGDDRS